VDQWGAPSGRMRERLQDERRGFADHCRVDATGDRVHALPETTTRLAFADSRAAEQVYVPSQTVVRHPASFDNPPT